MKTKLKVMLTVVAMVVLLTLVCINASAESGTCGDNLTWSLEDGTLVVSGTGDMKSYGISTIPWKNSKNLIEKAVVEEGVTSLSRYAFYEATNLAEVQLPSTLTSIGNSAFYECSSLNEINLPGGLTVIEDDLFYGCTALKSVRIPYTVVTYGVLVMQSVPKTAVIYGYNGSVAEELAKEYSLNFEGEEMPYAVLAEGNVNDNITWKVNTFGQLEITGTGAMTDYSDASSQPWVKYLDFVTDICISDGITHIGDYSLLEFEKIEKLVLGKDVVSIGKAAFKSCYALKEVVLNDCLQSIGNNAFYDCRQLTGIHIPDTVTSVGSSAFASCWALVEVRLPQGDVSWGTAVFENCSALTKVDIPEKMTTVPSYMFSGCNSLAEINFHDNITCIEKYAFEDALKNAAVILPKNLTKIGERAFRYSYMTSLTLPEGLTEVEREAFENCKNLEEVTIPTTLTVIPAGAFSNCSSLKTINFHDNITSIGARAFYGSLEGAHVVLPKGITSLESQAFQGCAMASITLHDGLTDIGANAFSSCKNITEISLPESVTVIPDSAFDNSNLLAKINMPSVTKIGSYAFASTGFETFVIPEGVAIIDAATFKNCSRLANITIPSTVLLIASDAFTYCPDEMIISGYTGSVAETYAAENGYGFVSLGEMTERVSVTGTTSTEGVIWQLTNFGNMVFSGEGDVNINSSYYPSWSEYYSFIETITFAEGITGVYNIKLEKLPNLKKLTYHYTVGYVDKTDLLKIPADTEIECYSKSIVEFMLNKYSLNFTSLGESPVVVMNSGKDGSEDGITWTVKSDGTLILSGSGKTYSHSNENLLPWEYYIEYITKLCVEEGITDINRMYINLLVNLDEIELAQSVDYIYNSLTDVPDAVNVKGYTYSVGELCANEAGLEFISLGEAPGRVIISGSVGDTATYSLDNRGNLTISGTGKTTSYTGDYDTNNVPWYYYRNLVKKLIVEEGINYMNYWQGSSHKNIEAIEMHYSVLIGQSFAGFDADTTVTGYANSYAAKMANELGLEFISLGMMPLDGIITGTIGDVSYSLNGYNTLTISGEGAVPVYNSERSYPWFTYQSVIKHIIIEEGIISFPYAAIGGSDYEIHSVKMPCSLEKFGHNRYAIMSDAIIYGYTYSYAQDYAASNSIEFVSLGIAELKIKAEGNLGDITWRYYNHHILELEGTGNMPEDVDIPWEDYKDVIEKVTMSEGITSIAKNAFKGSKITEVTIPSTVMAIGYNAFGETAITSIVIPDTVLAIDSYAFSNCDELESITLSSNLVMASFDMVRNCDGIKKVYGKVDTFAERLAEEIGAVFVSTGAAPERVYMKASVTETVYFEVDNLGDLTFFGVGEIPDQTVFYPTKDTVWGSYVTDNTDTVTVSGTITRIGNEAFLGLPVKNINIGEGVTHIGDDVFRYMNITEIRIPESVEEIGEYAFWDCPYLESVWLGRNLKAIPKGLFQYCPSLKYVEIPEAVSEIGFNAFYRADNVQYIHYRGTEEQWNKVLGTNNVPAYVTVLFDSYLPEETHVTVNRIVRSTNGANVSLTSSLRGGEAAYIAGYDADGTMVVLVKIEPRVTQYNIEGDISVVKVFFWDKETLIPINEVYSEKIN